MTEKGTNTNIKNHADNYFDNEFVPTKQSTKHSAFKFWNITAPRLLERFEVSAKWVGFSSWKGGSFLCNIFAEAFFFVLKSK
jgi:hypothetical protein